MELTAERIAEKLGTSREDVVEGHRVMALPLNDTMEPISYRSDVEREAELERMPKRMQDRIRKARG